MVGGVPGEGGRKWDEENKWRISLGQEKGYPFLPERRGGLRGMLKDLRGRCNLEERASQRNTSFSQVGERSLVGVME